MDKIKFYSVNSFVKDTMLYKVLDIDLEFKQAKTCLLFEFEMKLIVDGIVLSKEISIELMRGNSDKKMFKFNKFTTVIPLLDYYIEIINEYNTQGFALEFIDRYEQLIVDFKPYY